MKKTYSIYKCFGIIFLVLHLSVIFVFGFKILGDLHLKTAQMNPFGKYFSKIAFLLSPSEMPCFTKVYMKYTGTYTGYSFFSPNVFSHRIRFVFTDENHQELDLKLKTQESAIRFSTFVNTLNLKELENKERKKLIKSFSKRMFLQYPRIKKLLVFGEIISIEDSFKKEKKLFFEIDRVP